MKSSSEYKALVDKYDKEITELEQKIIEVETLLNERDKLLTDLKESGLSTKLSESIEYIQDMSSKLEQVSRYVGHIIVVKNKSFDNGELGKCSTDLGERSQELQQLLDEVNKKMDIDLPDEIKKIEDELANLNTTKSNKEKARVNANLDYLKALAIESSGTTTAFNTHPRTDSETQSSTPQNPVSTGGASPSLVNAKTNKNFIQLK